MKNLIEQKTFKVLKKDKLVSESVYEIDGDKMVSTIVKVPKTLISAFIKKVKDTSGVDVNTRMGSDQLSEQIVAYVTTALMNIDNLPVSIVLGTAYTKGVQVQPVNTTAQPVQPQTQTTQPVQPVQPAQNAQTPAPDASAQTPAAQTAQTPAAQTAQTPAAQTAAQISSQEI